MQRRLEITTNIGCALACSYCPQKKLAQAYRTSSSSGLHSPRVMSLRMFSHYISTVPSGVPIHFSGFSEPFHAPDCLAMITHALEKGHQVQLFTAADRLSRAQASELLKLPLSRFVVHVADAHGEMKIRIDDSYPAILEILATDSKIEFIVFGIPHPTTSSLRSRILSTRRVHDRAGNIEIKSNFVGTAFPSNETRTRLRAGSIVCRNDRMLSNVLLPNGEVQLCCMDYSMQHVIGNLDRQTYQDVVCGPKFMRIIEKMSDDREPLLCRSCEYAMQGHYEFTDHTVSND